LASGEPYGSDVLAVAIVWGLAIALCKWHGRASRVRSSTVATISSSTCEPPTSDRS
jgi:hypothetical protein